MPRHAAQKTVQLVTRNETAGRVIRVGHENQFGLRRDGGQHGVEIVPVVAIGDDLMPGADALHRLGVDDEAVTRIHAGIGVGEQGAGGHFQHVAGAMPEGDPASGNAQFLRQCLLERETVVVRITRAVCQCGADRLARLGRHAKRIFIRCELDDAVRLQTKLARHLGDRLAADIGRDRLHIAGSPAGLLCVLLHGNVFQGEGGQYSSVFAGRLVDGIGTQALVHGAGRAQCTQRGCHLRLVLMALDVDIEGILPVA
ncbi:hypothetical protein GALL_501910 [mine drainage metagenome]|uniref:Uncharacterized protein n=1 Tax=mine drainage metagenome TaxID=410659 RepID=A0A1J5PX78_9ZZZZ